MKRVFWHLGVVCLISMLALPVSSQRVSLAQEEAPRVAVAHLQDVSGTVVGVVSFTQMESNVVIFAQLNSLPPGFHGFHVHKMGVCDAAGENPFASAGGHHDAGGAAHGSHAGDLPVLMVMNSGVGLMTAVSDRFSVADLLDADGSAVVIHANPDNYANIPERYGVAVDEETTFTGDAGDRIACGVVESITAGTTNAAALEALQTMPIDQPAKVSRGENAETGSLVMTLHGMDNAQILGQITSGAAGQIGTMTNSEGQLVFTFTEITYDVAPIALPGGLSIGAQTIKLDPTQPNTLTVNLTTGEVTRNFHWIMSATDVLYNGASEIALGDTAKAEVAEVTDLGNGVYSVRLLTHWKTNLTLDTWTVAGMTLPSGSIDSIAEFDGIYMIDFNP